MSTRNADSLAGQGEFQPSIGRDEPMMTTGHQPGTKVSPADHAPEFSAKTLPPGSAPADRTFTPNTTSEVPGQADNDSTLRSHGKESTYTSAESTLGGSDSAAVHTGLGHPGQGQSAKEIRNEGKHGGKREGAGLEGVGATGGSGMPGQKALERDDPASGYRSDITGAEELPSASAEEVAAERD